MAGRKIVLALTLAGVAGCASAFLPIRDTGRWVCGFCGRHERQTRLLGSTWRAEVLSSAFHDLCVKEADAHHDHDWMRTGCHDLGGLLVSHSLACSVNREVFLIQDLIVQMAAPERRRAAIAVLRAFSPEQRRSEMRRIADVEESISRVVWSHLMEADEEVARFVADEGDPKHIPPAIFGTYAAWWNSRAAWQSVFPRPEFD